MDATDFLDYVADFPMDGEVGDGDADAVFEWETDDAALRTNFYPPDDQEN